FHVAREINRTEVAGLVGQQRLFPAISYNHAIPDAGVGGRLGEIEYVCVPNEIHARQYLVEARSPVRGPRNPGKPPLLFVKEPDRLSEPLAAFSKQGELEEDPVARIFAHITVFCDVREEGLSGRSASLQNPRPDS